MQKKVAMVVFRGEMLCFVHVMLNAVDMRSKGYDVKVIIEGESTKLLPRFLDRSEPFRNLFNDVLGHGMIDCACKACANKMGTIRSAQELGIELRSEMSGHPSISRMMEAGYEVITF